MRRAVCLLDDLRAYKSRRIKIIDLSARLAFVSMGVKARDAADCIVSCQAATPDFFNSDATAADHAQACRYYTLLRRH